MMPGFVRGSIDGGRDEMSEAAKEFVKLAERRVDQTEVEMAETVSKAYYTALIAEKKLELLEHNL